MFKQETNVQTFNSEKFGALRTQTVENGQILFCLNDVMKSLDLSHITKLKSRLNERGCTTSSVPTYNQYGAEVVQEMIFIDEPNLYRCIFQSRKKEAEQFQTWVFEEVLPSIRQTGGYLSTQQDDTPELIMARALQVAQATIENHKQRVQMLVGENEQLMNENKQLAPKAQYTDEVLQSASTYTFTQMAKELNFTSVNSFTNYLHQKRIIFRQSGQWMLTARYSGQGYTNTRTARFFREDGSIGTSTSTVWTEKGRSFLHNIVK